MWRNQVVTDRDGRCWQGLLLARPRRSADQHEHWAILSDDTGRRVNPMASMCVFSSIVHPGWWCLLSKAEITDLTWLWPAVLASWNVGHTVAKWVKVSGTPWSQWGHISESAQALLILRRYDWSGYMPVTVLSHVLYSASAHLETIRKMVLPSLRCKISFANKVLRTLTAWMLFAAITLSRMPLFGARSLWSYCLWSFARSRTFGRILSQSEPYLSGPGQSVSMSDV